jgi:hypothetical protein
VVYPLKSSAKKEAQLDGLVAGVRLQSVAEDLPNGKLVFKNGRYGNGENNMVPFHQLWNIVAQNSEN